MTGFMKERAAAIEAALAGGEVLRSHFGGKLEITYKGELDLVTQADTESEEAIVTLLGDRLPEVGILAEERGEKPGEQGPPLHCRPSRWNDELRPRIPPLLGIDSLRAGGGGRSRSRL